MLHAPVSDKKTKPETSRSEVEQRAEPLKGVSGWGDRNTQRQNSRLAATQQAYGNQAALRMMNSGVLQRKCACGNTAGSSGTCEACQSKREGILQTKLRISEPSDQYEREADFIADQVMRMPDLGTENQMNQVKLVNTIQQSVLANTSTIQRQPNFSSNSNSSSNSDNEPLQNLEFLETDRKELEEILSIGILRLLDGQEIVLTGDINKDSLVIAEYFFCKRGFIDTFEPYNRFCLFPDLKGWIKEVSMFDEFIKTVAQESNKIILNDKLILERKPKFSFTDKDREKLKEILSIGVIKLNSTSEVLLVGNTDEDIKWLTEYFFCHKFTSDSAFEPYNRFCIFPGLLPQDIPMIKGFKELIIKSEYEKLDPHERLKDLLVINIAIKKDALLLGKKVKDSFADVFKEQRIEKVS